jgi:hypothetical protein
MLTDTAGFFDFCIPLTNESQPPKADSLKKYYDFSVFNYITPPPLPRQLLQTTSAFRNHNLSPKHTGPLAINRQSTDWITVVFLACLFVFAWVQASYPRRLKQIFRAVAQPHHVNQLEREGNLFKERITLGLGFIYYTISAVFVYQLFSTFLMIPPGFNNFTFTGVIFVSLFFYQWLKSSLSYATGIIFKTNESARQYQLNIMIFNYVTGVFLFPVAIIAFYWNNIVLLISGAIIISLLLLYRLFRNFMTGLTNKNYNLFYLFLYLCTLEILPLLLLYKLISKF